MRFGVNPLSLRLPAVGRAARRLARRVGLLLRGERPGSFFDLHDLRAVNRVLAPAGTPPLAPDPRAADADPLGATRYVLALLASSPRLRAKFPRALSAGADGPFARWLLAAGDTGLSPAGRDHVRAAFAAAPRVRAERVYEIRADLRDTFPLALTPAGRGAYLAWVAAAGRFEEPDIDPACVLWMLAEHDEDPSRGLAQTYLVQPRWQERFPHALTRFGWAELKEWVRAEYGVGGRWLRDAAFTPRYGAWDELALLLRAEPARAATFPHAAAEGGDAAAALAWVRSQRLPSIDAAWEAALAADVRAGLPAQLGANVIGLFRYPSGLQQAATVVVHALAEVGVRTELRDIPVRTPRDLRTRAGFDGLERFPVTILNAGLDTSRTRGYREAGLHDRPGVHRVAVWWWELDRLPPEWLDRARDIDEIWAPTAFIAGAMRPLGKPVYLLPPSVELPAFDPLPKAACGLDPAKFTFLFVFDMNSRLARKNPLGLIKAFRRAFRPDEPVELVIKVSPQEVYYPDQWRELRAAVAANGVTLIDRALSRAALLGLMNAADAYVSLHRSEGFGLTMAEAMLLGKPTAATGYSGNVDFMTPENSYLIDYALAPITAPEVTAPPGAEWAEPSVEHAAAVMRAIYDRPEEATARGRRAQAELRVKLSHRAAGERMAARLRAILGGRR